MTRIAIVTALSFVLIGLWFSGRSAAQNRRGSEPAATQQQQQQHQQTKPKELERERISVTVNSIPTFMQAGRSYVFQPVAGEEFSGRVISLDATGWVQVQLRPGPDVGPLAEWFNLANMTSVKAMN